MIAGMLLGLIMSMFSESTCVELGQKLAKETFAIQYFLVLLFLLFHVVLLWALETEKKGVIGHFIEGFIIILSLRSGYLAGIAAFLPEHYRMFWWIGILALPLLGILGIYLPDKENFEENWTNLCETIEKALLSLGAKIKEICVWLGEKVPAFFSKVKRQIKKIKK